MHLIRRWDRKHGAELVRSKSKGRTGTFERYVVAQCVRPGVQLALALLHMPARHGRLRAQGNHSVQEDGCRDWNGHA